MKRILAPSLVLATALALSACTGSDDPTMEMPGMSVSESAPSSGERP